MKGLDNLSKGEEMLFGLFFAVGLFTVAGGILWLFSEGGELGGVGGAMIVMGIILIWRKK